jgi:RNA polymerase sigma-70 factor (ECF subfamily)
MTSSKEDTALIRGFQAGDKGAFDQLVLKHKDKLFTLCYRFFGDYHEANDVAQETFIRVYRSLRQFKFESAFATWLYRIAVNTCRNRLKSSAYRQKKATVSLDNPGISEGDDPSLEIADDSRSPVAELEKKERWMLIQRAISALPDEQRAVVALRDIQGLSYDEIAEITGSNLGTVKSRLARARLDLRERLRGVI